MQWTAVAGELCVGQKPSVQTLIVVALLGPFDHGSASSNIKCFITPTRLCSGKVGCRAEWVQSCDWHVLLSLVLHCCTAATIQTQHAMVTKVCLRAHLEGSS